ncbi:hypothetical protein DFP72DRAFT_799852 [Ephemerocybe angulata]|uniref:Integrase core domain-containing protein n=1 Tax=Ephemerocybe angulata TaxID=980116 RepID=A0A8H6MG81_9AGAR|nr:hypothetical protein DFP72DRAFT_799852 [Tulosesus angulatus]
MWGSSTFNTRIERLWVEVGTQFARAWRAFFYRLERRHLLNRMDKNHLWLLHFLFLDAINSDCEAFQNTWNSHPISGAGHDQSPDDMFFLGQLEHGIYADDCDGWSLQEIETYYGREQEECTRQDMEPGSSENGEESDSGRSSDGEAGGDVLESDSGSDTSRRAHLQQRFEARAAAAAHSEGANIRHAPIPVPEAANPFSNRTQFTTFEEALRQAREGHIVPQGYGLFDDEWEEFGGQYKPYEYIPTRHRGRDLRIVLPHDIWFNRAELWAQGLYLMNRATTLV